MAGLSLRRALSIGAFAGVSAFGAASFAAPTPEASRRADALFDEGTKLMDEGRFDRACPALRESLDIDPAAGTALALARCYEKAGKVASAWAAYQDAEARARAAGQKERERAANQQAAALAARLPRVAITFGTELRGASGLVVVLDGRTLSPGELAEPVPLDPGEHAVEVRADGTQTERRAFRVAEAEAMTLAFVGLATAQAPSTEPAAASTASSEGGSLRVVGFVVGGVGVVGLGIGSAFGILAAGANGDSNDACAPFESGRGGTAAAYDDCVSRREDAGGLADVSTVAFVAGGVLTAAGVGLVLFGGDDDESVAVALQPAPTFLTARGRF